MDQSVPRGGFEAFAFPHVPKVTHSAPWPPRCWPKVLPGCITSNFATIPVRPSAASRRSVPGYGAPESARSKSTAASPPQATDSTSASRGFPPGSSPRSHPSATRRSEWWAKDRCLHRSFRTMIRTLRALGVRVHDRNDHLPLHIQGPIRGGEVQIEGLVSSQFITGLLLALPIAEEETTIHVPHVISTPYIDITIDTAERFGIEILHKDYKEFYVAGATLPACGVRNRERLERGRLPAGSGGRRGRSDDPQPLGTLPTGRHSRYDCPRSGRRIRHRRGRYDHRRTPSAASLLIRRDPMSGAFPGPGRPGRFSRGDERHQRNLPAGEQGGQPRRVDPRGVRQTRHRGRSRRRGYDENPGRTKSGADACTATTTIASPCRSR